jgi:hypothetical protein
MQAYLAKKEILVKMVNTYRLWYNGIRQRVIKRIHIVPGVDVSFNVKWEKSQKGRHLFVAAVE